MKNFIFLVTLIILSIFWYGFQKGEINALEETQIVTDLSGANLTEVNLDGVVLCNTTMPDGRVNNSGCKT
mgnify:CR=1 FL=1